MSDALVPGLLITPAIRLSRQLGKGGMGGVWVADHLRLQTQVVVKFMSQEHSSNPEILARFEREASLGAQAKSPHVVQVFDHGTSVNGLPYIAMELLEGEDLGKRLARAGAVPAPVFAGWLAQACRGLARAHSKGIIHRDIKPENLFLCDDEGEVLVKILDFGIAKGPALGVGFSGTATGAMLGTPYYMSPEQTMGAKSIDHRADLWSLGVVTYYALTGVRPFAHEALGAVVAAITSQPIAPPSSHQPSLPFEIDAWMARALARDPDARFASAKEMADAFYAAIGRASGAPLDTTSAAPAAPWHVTPPVAEPRISTLAPSERTSTSVSLEPTARRWRLVGAATGIVVIATALALLHSHHADPPVAPPVASLSAGSLAPPSTASESPPSSAPVAPPEATGLPVLVAPTPGDRLLPDPSPRRAYAPEPYPSVVKGAAVTARPKAGAARPPSDSKPASTDPMKMPLE